MSTPLSPLIHLIDDDEAVRSSLALLISTVGLRVQTKPVDDELLIETLQNSVRQHVKSRQRNQSDLHTRAHYALLSEREREVLGLIVAGLTNKEIGRALTLSPRTVESHRANLFAKLEVDSLAQLIRQYAALVEEILPP